MSGVDRYARAATGSALGLTKTLPPANGEANIRLALPRSTRRTSSGPIHLGAGSDQKRTENPTPVKKSLGRPLKPKPARRSICVFGVGW